MLHKIILIHIYKKIIYITQKFLHLTKKNVHREIVTCAEICICVFVHSADLWFLHLEKYLRCRFAHFVHDGFCTFADLHICVLHICRKVLRDMWKCFCDNVRICEFLFAKVCAHVNLFFSCFCTDFCTFLSNLLKMSKKSKFPKMSRKCPKKAHVFLSGTRVVPGPTRLTTQGGKSRQNMH